MRPEELARCSQAAETMSETSEGTGTTSVSGKSGFDGREELRDLAAVLGIADPDEVHQDRFRVDRRKLEHMLLGKFISIFIFILKREYEYDKMKTSIDNLLRNLFFYYRL